MKKRFLIVLLLLTFVLTACLPKPAKPATPTKSTQAQAAAPTPPPPPADVSTPGAGMPNPSEDVKKVLSACLTLLQADANNAQAQEYFTQALKGRVSAGTPVSAILALQAPFNSFELSGVTFSPDGKQAIVQATLVGATSTVRRFVLVTEGEQWKIQLVETADAPIEYPTTPEGVVQMFLAAYQQAPDQMTIFLTPNLIAKIPAGGSVGDLLQLNGPVEGFVIESASASGNASGAALIVSLRAGGADAMRIFGLVQNNGLWQIDTIELPKQ